MWYIDTSNFKLRHYQSTSHTYLEQNYVDTRAADDMDPLAYIVTGAPLGVRLKRFEDAAYWAELTALFDRAKARNIPVLGVCWGGNALMFHRHGIALQRLPVKSIGLFDHATGVHATDFGLHAGATLPIPVARMSGFGPRHSVDYENILTDLEHPRLGPCLLRSVSGLDYAVGNHLEYDTATLRTEYDRDRGRGLTLDAAMTRLDTAAPWRPIAVQVYRHWLSTVVKP